MDIIFTNLVHQKAWNISTESWVCMPVTFLFFEETDSKIAHSNRLAGNKVIDNAQNSMTCGIKSAPYLDDVMCSVLILVFCESEYLRGFYNEIHKA